MVAHHSHGRTFQCPLCPWRPSRRTPPQKAKHLRFVHMLQEHPLPRVSPGRAAVTRVPA